MYIHKDPDYRPDPYPRWQGVGIFWGRNNNDEATAREILVPSPASEAGVRPGDVIIKVNGKNVTVISDNALAKLLENPHGSKVTLTLRRIGAPGPIRVSMVPRELLTGRIKASHTKK